MKLPFALGAAALALAAAPAMAVTTSVYVSGQGGPAVDSTTAGPQTFQGTLGTSDYFAKVAAGVLKVSAATVTPANPSPCCTFVGAGIGVTAKVTDTITVNSPGLTSGAFLASLLIDGTLDPQAAGGPLSGAVAFASVQVKVEVAGLATPVLDFSFTRTSAYGFDSGNGSLNGMRYSGPLITSFDFAIPFDNLVGKDVTISLFCGTSGINLQAGDATSAACDFAHTVKWGGVSQVVDENGAPVVGALVTGATGANYVNAFSGAVPEPASWALLIAGFGLVGAMARRRRGLLAA
jgi:hypothetical protein